MLKNILISPNEDVIDSLGNRLGCRIVQLSVDTFEVAPPLFWAPASDLVTPDKYYWDGTGPVELPLVPDGSIEGGPP